MLKISELNKDKRAASLRGAGNGIHRFFTSSDQTLAVFSTRHFDAAKDWKRFLESLNLPPGHFATVKQVHGAKVVTASPSLNPAGDLEADGMVTREPRLPLIIRTADCAPVFLFDPVTPAIGICHVGWRGAKAGMIERTVEKMEGEFGTSPARLEAAVGPAICVSCYEVGKEFKSDFPNFVTEKDSRYYFDLIGEVKSQLYGCGVSGISVKESGFCTACSTDRFFSARREGQETGRLLSLLMLE